MVGAEVVYVFGGGFVAGYMYAVPDGRSIPKWQAQIIDTVVVVFWPPFILAALASLGWQWARAPYRWWNRRRR